MSKDISNGDCKGSEVRRIGSERTHAERKRERNLAMWADWCRGLRLEDIASKYDLKPSSVYFLLVTKYREYLETEIERLGPEIERLRNINTALENEIALQRMLLEQGGVK